MAPQTAGMCNRNVKCTYLVSGGLADAYFIVHFLTAAARIQMKCMRLVALSKQQIGLSEHYALSGWQEIVCSVANFASLLCWSIVGHL